MKIPFEKYHGNGNDFILIDNRKLNLTLNNKDVVRICDRRFGVGSDGLILIEDSEEADYYMNFYNPDASQSFCGNGSRCALHFCNELGIINDKARFLAIDGLHKGRLDHLSAMIQLNDVSEIITYKDCYFVNTGSPHAVVIVKNIEEIDVLSNGKKLRNDPRFQPEGTNVNFVEIMENGLRSRVYERGVEFETYSSGTGTTAQALCAYKHSNELNSPIEIETKGGNLSVDFEDLGNDQFTGIWLNGSVKHVFTGNIDL